MIATRSILTRLAPNVGPCQIQGSNLIWPQAKFEHLKAASAKSDSSLDKASKTSVSLSFWQWTLKAVKAKLDSSLDKASKNLVVIEFDSGKPPYFQIPSLYLSFQEEIR